MRVWECPPKPIQSKGKIHLFRKVEITLSDWNGLWILSQIGLLILGALSVQQELPLANQCIAIRTLKNKMMESWRLIKRKIISFYYAHERAHFFFYQESTLFFSEFCLHLNLCFRNCETSFILIIWDKIQWTGLKYWREFCQGPYCLHVKLWFFSAEKIICFHF